MQKNVLVRSVLVGAAVCAVGSAAFAGENWVGTWKLNAAKSNLGTTAVRPQTLTFEATTDGIKLTSVGTDAQGKAVQGSYTSKFDGKDVPWTGNPMADTASPKKIDDNSFENTWKQGGKATVSSALR